MDDKSGNVAAQLAISNCFEKSVDLGGVALNFELYSTVDKVLNPPDHFVTGGQVPDDIPETDPLDASFVENTFGNHNPLRQGFEANRRILFLRREAPRRTIQTRNTSKKQYPSMIRGRLTLPVERTLFDRVNESNHQNDYEPEHTAENGPRIETIHIVTVHDGPWVHEDDLDIE